MGKIFLIFFTVTLAGVIFFEQISLTKVEQKPENLRARILLDTDEMDCSIPGISISEQKMITINLPGCNEPKETEVSVTKRVVLVYLPSGKLRNSEESYTLQN